MNSIFQISVLALCMSSLSSAGDNKETSSEQSDRIQKQPTPTDKGTAGGASKVENPQTAEKSKDTAKTAAEIALKKGLKIHTCLVAYGSDKDNGRVFPQGPTANEALRSLFVRRLIDREDLFFVAEHDIHGSLAPDNLLGPEPLFPMALGAGECAWSYVNGSSSTSNKDQPLLFTHLKDKNSGTVFTAVITVGGDGYVVESKDGVPRIEVNGAQVNILSEEYGTNPEKIVHPIPRVTKTADKEKPVTEASKKE